MFLLGKLSSLVTIVCDPHHTLDNITKKASEVNKKIKRFLAK